MPKKCIVTGCGNHYNKDKNVTYFSFPKDPERRMAWLRAIGENNLHIEMKANMTVCSRHFNKDEYHVVNKGLQSDGATPLYVTRLHRLAIPKLSIRNMETKAEQIERSTSHFHHQQQQQQQGKINNSNNFLLSSTPSTLSLQPSTTIVNTTTTSTVTSSIGANGVESRNSQNHSIISRYLNDCQRYQSNEKQNIDSFDKAYDLRKKEDKLSDISFEESLKNLSKLKERYCGEKKSDNDIDTKKLGFGNNCRETEQQKNLFEIVQWFNSQVSHDSPKLNDPIQRINDLKKKMNKNKNEFENVNPATDQETSTINNDIGKSSNSNFPLLNLLLTDENSTQNKFPNDNQQHNYDEDSIEILNSNLQLNEMNLNRINNILGKRSFLSSDELDILKKISHTEFLPSNLNSSIDSFQFMTVNENKSNQFPSSSSTSSIHIDTIGDLVDMTDVRLTAPTTIKSSKNCDYFCLSCDEYFEKLELFETHIVDEHVSTIESSPLPRNDRKRKLKYPQSLIHCCSFDGEQMK
ncbi:hypothetical protein SNEBB_005091 [Seison nebaliae]|nr:hypothetical protein SNEBB_005091 [Seison nebaliae]